MCKENFTRETQKTNNLKQVIIRIDYAGMASAERVVNKLSKELKEKFFTSMNRTMLSQAKLNFSNAAEIARTLSIPIEELKNIPLFEFNVSPFVGTKDTVKLEVCNLYTALTVNTQEYGGVKPYRDFFTWFVGNLYAIEPFLSIKRLGIRKKSGDPYGSIEEINHIYEPKYYFGETIDHGNGMIRREYQDCFWNDEKNIKVNYNRGIRTVRLATEGIGMQVVLDIDVYVDDGIIEKEKYDFKEHFEQIFNRLNDYQYDLYKRAVTAEYLDKTSK
jgi:uncharacterized protein (TIGR04255 family)